MENSKKVTTEVIIDEETGQRVVSIVEDSKEAEERKQKWEEVKKLQPSKPKVIWQQGTAVKQINENGDKTYNHTTSKNYFMGRGTKRNNIAPKNNSTKKPICKRTGKIVDLTKSRSIPKGVEYAKAKMENKLNELLTKRNNQKHDK